MRLCSTFCREQANSAYVLWVVAFNVSFLCLYLAVDTFQGPTAQSSSDAAPALFQALNKNSLAVFLLVRVLLSQQSADDLEAVAD